MSSEPGAFLCSFTSFFDHGLLVLEDASSQAKHDEWDASAETIHLDVDSLYVGVCPSVDGPVKVSVYENDRQFGVRPEGMAILFSGQLTILSGYLVITDSDNTMKSTLRRIPGSLDVIVWGDVADMATEVAVLIHQESQLS